MLIALLIIIFLLIWSVRSERMPGPTPIPFFGNSLQIKSHPNGVLQYFVENCKRFGPVTRFWIGSKPLVMITDFDDIEILLRTLDHTKKSITYDYIKPLLGEGLVTASGKGWHSDRKMLTPAFHYDIIKRFLHIFRGRVEILLENLEEKVGGDVFDVHESAMGITLDLENERNSTYRKALKTVLRLCQDRTFNPFWRSDFVFRRSKAGSEFFQCLDIINDFSMNIINERRRQLKDADYSQLMIDENGEEMKKPFLDSMLMDGTFSDQKILDQVNTIIFAGHESIANGISFTLYNLGQNQDVQRKVYEELLMTCGRNLHHFTATNFRETKYMNMVLRETFRMYPSVPVFGRYVESDLKLKNTTITAGTSVSCFAYLSHRNPEVFPDPEVFDPERFADESRRGRHAYAQIPFSAGPRSCIGQKFALVQVKLVLGEVLRRYAILPGQKIGQIRSMFTLKPEGGIRIRVRRRSSSVVMIFTYRRGTWNS
ncbi:PREDICTED: cytochrome P450 4C1-like isoform X2 [Nicrophorus vespilloides]|uniref:Cytochrome P450 4C1-like isoform X2 n=1 Tax=Nicrophorus vespilloides TaxID=110193 RepID=A0ABM1MI23_NICVS|nr:PREDICTED: cytochrome P450 4C1-like isoform X2 [Nicrophorus vespilloides]